ncbi:tRNA pseudouridine synthase B [Candidatus Megaera polyxenophila]|uniref:tRNA pseudouridine(55) synthase TruB n=1 Tax=Candidatus Megaera polyxenophila TaxID=988779 RepID=UPI00249E343E|nr:tRNA pseudouridine(55) synthase TruB [Candidatus Megaera polyxenophila]BBB56919.1 tRNA pseudouridine synthase B [Candidatus Megaera polyxenophila]
MDGWLNLYKPRGISSAKAVAVVKSYFKKSRIGHTGTLDLEAEGVLPIAIGQATKLVSILINSSKEYIFTIQFGSQTDTGDLAGKIIKKTDIIPTEDECLNVCHKFVGIIKQIPPIYSALKINGVRAYKLARQNKEFEVNPRFITIYDLKLLCYDSHTKRATYVVNCSKGTYVRTLAEDISLSLHSLGFVVELRRTRVGIFTEENSINMFNINCKTFDEAHAVVKSKCLKVEDVLDDIPVLEVDELVAQKIRYGQQCDFDKVENHDQIWLKYDNKILAIGSLSDESFKSSRVFNYKKDGEE